MRVALTGSIASGKSTVAEWFKTKKVPVIDCDALVHESYAEGGALYLAVTDAFGPRIISSDGAIDRRVLGDIVFNDSDALQLLSSITHPIVREMVNQQANALESEGNQLIIVDVPLLFESNMQHYYDKVIVVSVNPEVQLSRLVSRNGYSYEEATKRIASQMAVTEKAKLADFVLDNNGDLIDLYAALDKLYLELIAK